MREAGNAFRIYEREVKRFREVKGFAQENSRTGIH